MSDHLVHETIFLGLHRIHDPVALDVMIYNFDGLLGVPRQYVTYQLSHPHYLFGVDPDVGRLARYSPDRRLMDQYPRVWKRESFAGSARSQQHRAQRGALAHANCRHIRPDELHGVVYGHPGGYGASRTVYV